MAGYIGNIPTPQATQSRQSFTATASQTTFATVGYTAGFIDVYLNGVHLLDGTDYTATNGSDIVLTTGAALNDVVEFVAYETFSVLDQSFTGTTTTEAFTTTGAFTSLGIDDNATSTAITIDASENVLVGKTSANFANAGVQLQPATASSFTQDGVQPLSLNRLTSNGDILKLFKDGTTVGSIGVAASTIYIGKAETGVQFIAGVADRVVPYNTTTQTFNDGGLSLGYPDARWSNLYLSGGVYLGGTGAANKLDDYEEGTCQLVHGGVNMTGEAHYEKIGRLVTVHFDVTSGVGSTTTNLIDGLPYAFEAPNGTVHVGFSTAAATIVGGYVSNTNFRFITAGSTSAQNLAAGERIIGVAIYKTAT